MDDRIKEGEQNGEEVERGKHIKRGGGKEGSQGGGERVRGRIIVFWSSKGCLLFTGLN